MTPWLQAVEVAKTVPAWKGKRSVLLGQNTLPVHIRAGRLLVNEILAHGSQYRDESCSKNLTIMCVDQRYHVR